MYLATPNVANVIWFILAALFLPKAKEQLLLKGIQFCTSIFLPSHQKSHIPNQSVENHDYKRAVLSYHSHQFDLSGGVFRTREQIFFLQNQFLWCILVSQKVILTKNYRLKGISSKPSGDCIVAPIFCFLSQRLQILATCLFFFSLTNCKVSERLDNIHIRHFTRVSPLLFFCFCNLPKIQRGDPCKMSNINVVQSF